MSRPIARRSTLLLAAAAALMVAAFAAVPAAQASSLYACVTKSGSAHLYTKKPKKCKSKKEKLVSWNNVGPAGRNGANGANGGNGTNGANGANGAVAGFGAVQTSNLNITNAEGFTQVPGLTKVLPAGTFIASGNVEIDATGEHEKEFASGDCEMINTPSSGSPLVQEGRWVSQLGTIVILIIVIHVTDGQIPLHMAINNSGVTSTLAIKCKENGRGEEVTETATNGSMVAIQTSGNS